MVFMCRFWKQSAMLRERWFFHALFCQSLFLFLLMGGCTEKETDPAAAFKNKQYATAHKLWLPQAEQGDADAQNALGTIYYLGLGVERDYRKALKWFELAATQGHPRAQRNAGMMHEHGMGVPQDFFKAYVWLYAAHKQGNEAAQIYINSLVSKLTPNQQIKARRMAHEFIIDPVSDYRAEPKVHEGRPVLKDLRDSG